MSRASPGRAAMRLAVPLLAGLIGCTWVDTRPEVTVTPGGDLVARDTIDLRVDAGGAPKAQIVIDGVRVGGLIATGATVTFDLTSVSMGVHELVARVEDGAQPRQSAPQRLEIRRNAGGNGYVVPVKIEVTSGPWDPITAQVTSPNTLVRVTAAGEAPATVPESWGSLAVTVEPAGDGHRFTLRSGATTLAQVGGFGLRVQVEDDMGFEGSATIYEYMPTSISVIYPTLPLYVTLPFHIVATPAVPVPSATLWASQGGIDWVPITDVGPSPWDVVVAPGQIGSGYWNFQFRRDDVRLDGYANATVLAPSLLTSCEPAGGAPGLTSAVCAVASYATVPTRVEIGSTSLVGLQPGDLTLTPGPTGTWSLCISDRLWKMGPIAFAVDLVGYGPGGRLVDRSTCSTRVAWTWTSPGADPVTDGTAPVSAATLGLHAPSAAEMRLGWLAGAPGAGDIHIATRSVTPGSFSPGDPLNAVPAAAGAVAIGNASAVAWSAAAAPGNVEGLLQSALGASWSSIPPGVLGPATGNVASAPSVAMDASGAPLLAWVESNPDGSSLIRVRRGAAGDEILPAISPSIAGAFVDSPSIAASMPGFPGPGVTYVQVASDGIQSAHVVVWDGARWVAPWGDLPTWNLGPRGVRAAKPLLAADASQAWVVIQELNVDFFRYQAAQASTAASWVWQPLQVPQGLPPWANGVAAIGLPASGLPVAFVGTGRPEYGSGLLLACRGATCQVVESAIPVSIAIDPDAMSVAWTDADGFIHVRTLTP